MSYAERAAQQAARLRFKYDRHGYAAEARATNNRFLRRANQYKILPAAAPPAGSNAAGIAQDGTDYSYFVQVQLGSKKQPMYMLVDTGAGSSWVMGKSCTSDSCKKHGLFGPEDSDTLEMTSDDFSIAYGTGQVKGKLSVDTISVADMSLKYRFGLASETSQEFASFAFDGILGLSMGKGASDNFLETVSKEANLPQNIFAIALNRASDGANNGEIKFGGINPAKFTGELKYTKVGVNTGEWAIPMDDLGFDSKKAGIGALAYIDTGTSFMFGPDAMVKKLHDSIPGAVSAGQGAYTVPCDTSKSLFITFSGVDYEIPPKDFVSPKDNAGKCTSNVYGHEVVKGAWLMGDTFLKNVYTVFDKDNKQVGFARASGAASSGSPPPPSPAVTTPNSPSGTTSNSSSGVAPGTTPPPSSSMTATESKPGMGLTGHESKSGSDGASATAAPAKSENAATGLHAGHASMVSLVAIVTSLALLA